MCTYGETSTNANYVIRYDESIIREKAKREKHDFPINYISESNKKKKFFPFFSATILVGATKKQFFLHYRQILEAKRIFFTFK